MATRVAERTRLSETLDSRGCSRVSWTGLLNGDDGEAVELGAFRDRSVQVVGVPGVGGSVRIEGSNDGGTTFHALNDPQGNALDITTLKIEQLLEITHLIRPRVTAGDGSTNLAVHLFLAGG